MGPEKDPTGQCWGVLFGNKDFSSFIAVDKGKVNVILLMSIASKMYSKKQRSQTSNRLQKNFHLK